jgi:hypothetical protein
LRETCAERRTARAGTSQHVKFDVHLGDPVYLNVERGSKVGNIKDLLLKTRVDLLKRRHRSRLHHGVIG